MDSWPCHGKTDALESLNVAKTFSYPLVTHGGPNLVSLVEREGHFQWTTLFKDEKLFRLHATKTHVAFPPTYPSPLALPHLSLKQRAEQGANFIRTYHPDVDIPSELIREHLTEATQYTDELRVFDPYAGNLLESIIAGDANDRKHVYIAFPVGELKNDLNVSPLLCSEEGQLTFKPSVNSVKRFQTPILQIVPSRDSDPRDRTNPSGKGPYFAVRTHGSTTLFELEPPKESGPVLNDLATLSASNVGGNTIQDVKLTSGLDVFVVNNQGAVFLAACGQERVASHLIHNGPRVTQTIEHHDLWRIALGSSRYECTLISGIEARLLDSRARSSLTLFSLDVLQDRFTSLEDEGPDGIIRFCTTEQIGWIDKRYPKRPLLGLKHSRNYDPTLQTETVQFQRRPITFLTSRRNSLITVYDVSRLDQFHLSVHNPPYCLSLSTSYDKGNPGQLFFRHPYNTSDSGCTVFHMCGRGGMNCFGLSLPALGGADIQVEWSDGVKELQYKVGAIQEDIGALGVRDRTEFDFSAAYEHLFLRYEEQQEKREDEEAEKLYEVIEQAPLFWQKADTAEEQVLTAHDLLFRTGEEPQEISKATFSSKSVINSVRGYRALNQGRLSSTTLGKGAAWTCDITPTLRHFVPEATQNIQELTNYLSQSDLPNEGGRSYKSIQREARAREQLALDLVLASSIYSSHSIVGSKRVRRNLESMTEALSLNNDAPPMHFGYLHPLKQGIEESNGDVMGAPGVRMLLKEWQIGADPKASFHEDDPTLSVERAGTGISPPVQPPTVAASRTPLVEPGESRYEISSQVQTQTIGDSEVSTQIEPRSRLSKKKMGKKRMGGF